MAHVYTNVTATISGNVVNLSGSVDGGQAVTTFCNLNSLFGLTISQIQDFIAVCLLNKAIATGVLVDTNIATTSQAIQNISTSFSSSATTLPASPIQSVSGITNAPSVGAVAVNVGGASVSV